MKVYCIVLCLGVMYLPASVIAGNAPSGSAAASKGDYPYSIYGGENSDGESDGEVVGGTYRFRRSEDNQWYVEVETPEAYQLRMKNNTLERKVGTAVSASVVSAALGGATLGPVGAVSAGATTFVSTLLSDDSKIRTVPARSDCPMTFSANDIRGIDH